ncbi:MAG: OstA-like protein [Bacteroidota bacterium]
MSLAAHGQVPPNPQPKSQGSTTPQVVDPQLEQQDTSKKAEDIIIIDFADRGVGIDTLGQQLFKGEDRQVELRQGETYMYCDSAFLYENNDVRAWGNVIIQQGDSVNIFSDSLLYQGFEKKADLYGEVILESDQQKLFTDQLTYDLNTKIATYYNGATLTNDTTQLTSKRGYFYVDQDVAFFKDSVVVVDPEFELKSDTLRFDTKNKIAYFLGPTLIVQNDGKIYCEDGFYDTRNKQAEFTKNAQYQKGEQKAWADVMRYDGTIKETKLTGDARFVENDKRAKADVIRYEEGREITHLEGNAFYQDAKQEIKSDRIRYNSKDEIYSTAGRSRLSDPPQILEADNIDYDGKFGFAVGDVIWQDTAANISISHCDSASYIRDEDFFKAMGGRPLLTTLMDDDTLFLSSDTLIAYKPNPEDSLKTLVALDDVRMFKSDLQAICDSLVYSEADSIFKFYEDPVIWSDTSQFSADTIHIQLANDEVDRIYMYRNSFMINSPDEIFFNQIKGKDNTVFFEAGDIRRMQVDGNAESLYFALDDDKRYIGANKTVASQMMIFFGNNEVENIRFYTQPKAKFTPIKKLSDTDAKLGGFDWQIKDRPLTLDDLFKIKVKKVPPTPKATEEEIKPEIEPETKAPVKPNVPTDKKTSPLQPKQNPK